VPYEIVKETDKYIEYKTGLPSTPWSTGLTREQKFLCIGGPKNGQLATQTMLAQENLHYHPYKTAKSEAHAGYHRYNSSGGTRNTLRCVYVWVELGYE
jgi:hypothetical protein